MAEIANEETDPSGEHSKAARTTIVPAADGEPTVPPARRTALRSLNRDRVETMRRHHLAAARPPIAGTRLLRLALAGMLFLMSLATLGGAVIVLLLWQQYRDSGVLTTQIDRAWGLVEDLRLVERALAFGVVPVALAWIVLATLNARRGTGQRRNPVVPAIALLVGVVGIWVIGAEVVVGAETWIERLVGYALQAVGVVVPLLALERVAEAAEARRRPMHVTALLAIVAVVVLQERGGLSTILPTDDADRWGMMGVDLVILALIQALGALAANEAARAIEEGSHHRYQLRSRFSESVLTQAGLD